MAAHGHRPRMRPRDLARHGAGRSGVAAVPVRAEDGVVEIRRILAGGACALLALGVAASDVVALEAANPVDANATGALAAMGNYLRGLKSFQVSAQVATEDVLDNGMKVERRSTVTTVARPPDRLATRSSSDSVDRSFYFNGKEFTLWSPRLRYYATIDAPGTIGQLADTLEAKYATELPLVDLFRWGAPGNTPPAFAAAVDLGPSSVGGVTCTQYAFRQDGLDWQVWIQRGEHPLPRRVVLTTTDDEARPQYSATYDWNLAPSYNEATFTFAPPKDAQRIVMREGPAGE